MCEILQNQLFPENSTIISQETYWQRLPPSDFYLKLHIHTSSSMVILNRWTNNYIIHVRARWNQYIQRTGKPVHVLMEEPVIKNKTDLGKRIKARANSKFVWQVFPTHFLTVNVTFTLPACRPINTAFNNDKCSHVNQSHNKLIYFI